MNAKAPPRLMGVDFTSAPSRRKQITVARGHLAGARVVLERVERVETLVAFEALLREPAPWLGAFDLPFGLPRELVEQLHWPTDWRACIAHYAALTRPQIRATFAAFCAARPAGRKFAHRVCDGPAGSSPSMKWVNPPVAYMLHAGVPRLLAAGVWLPAHERCVLDEHMSATHRAPPDRIALEAYPGLLARELIGSRSYKSDDRARQTADRLIARLALVDAIEQGRTRLGLRLKLTAAQRGALADDASGDAIDAALCLVQAGWAALLPGYGLPVDVDPLEGWIVSAGAGAAPARA